jgi:predicted HAD superfamily Cof-like phosphohydrolase
MTQQDEDFELLRENHRRAEQQLPEPPRMKSLAEAIAPCEAALRERWARQDAKKAELESTPHGQRIEQALALVQGRIPRMLQEQSSILRARIKPEVLEVVDAWNWDSGSVLLCGPTRIGKTHAAGVLVRRILSVGVRMGAEAWEKAKRIDWAHASDLANARKRHPLGEDEAPELERASIASLLVLDDLGWDIEPAPICDVLNKRYERGVPTIVTSGLDPARVFERYSEAVARRIFDSGGTKGRIADFFGKQKPKEHPAQKSLDETWKQTPDRTTLETKR